MRLLSYVLPLNLLFFGAAFAGLAILRLPYTSTLLATIGAATLVLSYLITVLTRAQVAYNMLFPVAGPMN